jgi:hypothetical protein
VRRPCLQRCRCHEQCTTASKPTPYQSDECELSGRLRHPRMPLNCAGRPFQQSCMSRAPGKALSPHETLAASTRGRPIARGVHDTAVQTQRVFVTRDSERDWWIASCQAPLPWLHSWRAPSSAMPQEKPIPGHGGRDEAKPTRPPPAIKGVGVSSVLGLRAQLLRCSSLQLCSALFTLSVYPTLVRMPPPCNGAHI